jgi:uncharacterized membrane protein YozB (DUF420 family)
MNATATNRASAVVILVLSLIAFVTVLTGFLPGHPPQADEGTQAHIFQLAIVLIAPAGLVFLATADWERPAEIARRLALPAVAVALAFAALYYLEHYFQPAHYR